MLRRRRYMSVEMRNDKLGMDPRHITLHIYNHK